MRASHSATRCAIARLTPNASSTRSAPPRTASARDAPSVASGLTSRCSASSLTREPRNRAARSRRYPSFSPLNTMEIRARPRSRASTALHCSAG